MKFRTDISFLRAVAVLIVMLFHFQVRPFSGGFIGVDVFFVISGFLMTQIILQGIDSEKFSLRQFYTKRIDRIIPPLQILLVFVIIISIVFFFQSDLKLNTKYTFLSDFFISNIYFWRYIDYFSSTDNILLHTWSLGVEWQFYLIYPLIILLLKSIFKNKEKIFWGIIATVTVLSFLVMITTTRSDNNFAFYMLPSRFWELSIGGLAFIVGKNVKLTPIARSAIVSLGVIGIFLCSIFISEKDLWPSYYTLIPVFCTVAILSINLDAKVFGSKLMSFFGNISYSLYLWHWPWFILFKYFGFLGGYYTLVLIIISVLSAVASYKWIEKNRKLSNTRFALVSTFVVAILSAGIFFKPHFFKGFSIYQNKRFEIGDYQSEYLRSKKEKQFNSCHCYITNQQTSEDFNYQKCLQYSTTRKNILLLGDSHAAQYSASFRELSQYNIMEVSTGYTFPVINSKGKKSMVSLMQSVFTDFIPSQSNKIDLVIISAHWLMRHNPEINYSDKEVIEKLTETITFLQKYKIKFLIIGQTEAYELTYPKILMLKNFGQSENRFIKDEAKEINDRLKNEIGNRDYIDIYKNPEVKHFELKSQQPYMFDGNHLTKYGADQIVQKLLLPRIIEKLEE